MTLQVLEVKDEFNSSLGLSYKCSFLPTEEIILYTHEYETVWNYSAGGTHTFIKKEPIKFILKELCYSYNHYNHYDDYGDSFHLDRIVVLGFRKDNKVKAKTEWLNTRTPQFDEVVSQIPDNYHDRARKAFQELTQQLQEELNRVIKNGVKVS
mgnify:FL=1